MTRRAGGDLASRFSRRLHRPSTLLPLVSLFTLFITSPAAAVQATGTVTLDRTPPVASITSPASGARFVSGENVPISFAATDVLDPSPVATGTLRGPNGENQAATSGSTLQASDLAAGAWTLSVAAEDWAENRGTPAAVSFEVVHDVLPPRTSLAIGAPRATGGPDGSAPGETFVTSATPFTLSAVDDLVEVGDGLGLGVASVLFSIDGEAERSGVKFTLEGRAAGPRAIAYRSIDVAGNEEAAKTAVVHLDDDAPAITVAIGAPQYKTAVSGSATYVTSATPITATASDAGVGLSTLDGPTFPLAEGVRALTFRAADLLGNAAETTVTVIVDDAAPTTTLSVDVTDTTGVVLIPESLITIEATDGPSPGTANVAAGVASTTFSVDGDTPRAYAGPFTPRDLGLAFGAHAIAFASVDNLGNAEVETTFEFTLSPALEVSRRIDHAPRILVWRNEGGAQSAAVEAALASGALSVRAVEGKDTFIREMRTGAYNVFAVLGEAERLSNGEVGELAARVDAGAGLVAFEYDRIDGPMLGHDRREGTADVARDNVLGVRVAGLNVESGTVEVAEGVLADAAYTFVAAGGADRVRDHVEAVVPGRFVGVVPETPAITLRRYGTGKAIYVDFAATSAPAALLERLVAAVAPETGPIVPGGIVVLAIDVKSLVVPLDLTVKIDEMLPPGVTVLDVRPAPQSQQPHLLTWYVVLDVGEETTVGYGAIFPAGASSPEAIVSYLVRGTYREFGRFKIDVTAAARGDVAREASDSMLALAATLPTRGGDRQRVEAAAAKVAAAGNAIFTSSDQVEAAIKDVVGAIESVTRTEDPAGRSIRDLLDVLVETLEREWSDLEGAP